MNKKYHISLKVIILAILVTFCCISCATNKPNINNSDNFDNQPYFPGCATITSKCNL
jgi:hypothetical protein